MASLSGKPRVILSSGSRVDLGMEEDVGVLALRNPSDLQNICQVIMKFDARMAYELLHTAGTYALQQAQIRRFGESSIRIAGIRFVENGGSAEEELPRNGVKDDSKVSSKTKKANSSSSAAINDNGNDESSAQESEGNAQEDGFIAF
jgi:hypothetical protein